MHRMSDDNPSGTVPLFAIGAAVALVVTSVVALAVVDLNKDSTPFLYAIIGLVVSTVPALIGAAFSERASRDIRNGVVSEKAREGAAQALDEKGVTQAVKDGEGTTPAALRALTAILEANTRAQDANTAAQPKPGDTTHGTFTQTTIDKEVNHNDG